MDRRYGEPVDHRDRSRHGRGHRAGAGHVGGRRARGHCGGAQGLRRGPLAVHEAEGARRRAAAHGGCAESPPRHPARDHRRRDGGCRAPRRHDSVRRLHRHRLFQCRSRPGPGALGGDLSPDRRAGRHGRQRPGARAGGRGGSHHAVQFPVHAEHGEGIPRHGRGLQRGSETPSLDAAQCLRDRQGGARGGTAAGRFQRDHRTRGSGRRDLGKSRYRHGDLYRVHRHRAPHHVPLRRPHKARATGTRWQERPGGAGRRIGRSGAPNRFRRRAGPLRPGLCAADAAVDARAPDGCLPGGRSRGQGQHRHRRHPRPGDGAGARSSASSSGTRWRAMCSPGWNRVPT